jgi:hypothetical protein
MIIWLLLGQSSENDSEPLRQRFAPHNKELTMRNLVAKSWIPRPGALAGLLAAGTIATAAAPAAILPVAAADPHHTVVFQVLGRGDVFSVIPDPGTPVYPASTSTWVPTPWSQTVQVTGSPYLALNWTDHNGNHDCAITVDGQHVPLTEHSQGRCAYQIPG